MTKQHHQQQAATIARYCPFFRHIFVFALRRIPIIKIYNMQSYLYSQPQIKSTFSEYNGIVRSLWHDFIIRYSRDKNNTPNFIDKFGIVVRSHQRWHFEYLCVCRLLIYCCCCVRFSSLLLRQPSICELWTTHNSCGGAIVMEK